MSKPTHRLSCVQHPVREARVWAWWLVCATKGSASANLIAVMRCRKYHGRRNRNGTKWHCMALRQTENVVCNCECDMCIFFLTKSVRWSAAPDDMAVVILLYSDPPTVGCKDSKAGTKCRAVACSRPQGPTRSNMAIPMSRNSSVPAHDRLWRTGLQLTTIILATVRFAHVHFQRRSCLISSSTRHTIPQTIPHFQPGVPKALQIFASYIQWQSATVPWHRLRCLNQLEPLCLRSYWNVACAMTTMKICASIETSCQFCQAMPGYSWDVSKLLLRTTRIGAFQFCKNMSTYNYIFVFIHLFIYLFVYLLSYLLIYLFIYSFV